MKTDVVIRVMKLFEELMHDMVELETTDEKFQTYETAVKVIRDKCNWELMPPDLGWIGMRVKQAFYEAVDNDHHLTKSDRAEILVGITKQYFAIVGRSEE